MVLDSVEPLVALLEKINERLCVIESKVGLSSQEGATSNHVGSTIGSPTTVSEQSPAVKAYNDHVIEFVLPLVQTCETLSTVESDPKMKDVGSSIQRAWEGIGKVVELASHCRKPIGGTPKIQEALMPYLKETQDAITSCRQLRLKREFDNHQKALMEFFAAVSWVVMFPPPTSPSVHVKETLGAMEFYSNKIRREYKGKEGKEAHITFCDQTKAVILDLTKYTKEHHGLGLTFNPNGCATFEEGSKLVVGTKSPTATESDTAAPENDAKSSKPSSKGEGSGGGGIKALMSELANKSNKDGSSAATGLKKVTKEQQTWRKEFNSEAAGEVKQAAPSKVSKSSTKAKVGSASKPPVFEFDEVGQKWKIEYQTKETNPHLKVEVKGRNEQVYIYKCTNMTVEISGKLKAIVVDGCTKVNVVFGTVISGFEVVNSKSIQVQTLGVCPTVGIDKTDGCMVYLSKESKDVTNFMTSKSSEMHVSWPDDNNELQESPIPEQFQHKLVNGSITSTVSDLYH